MGSILIVDRADSVAAGPSPGAALIQAPDPRSNQHWVSHWWAALPLSPASNSSEANKRLTKCRAALVEDLKDNPDVSKYRRLSREREAARQALQGAESRLAELIGARESILANPPPELGNKLAALDGEQLKPARAAVEEARRAFEVYDGRVMGIAKQQFDRDVRPASMAAARALDHELAGEQQALLARLATLPGVAEILDALAETGAAASTARAGGLASDAVCQALLALEESPPAATHTAEPALACA